MGSGGSCSTAGAWGSGHTSEHDDNWIGHEAPEGTRAKGERVTDPGVHPSVGQVASDCSILAVGAVLGCDVLVRAPPEGGLLSRASNFTQVDGTHAWGQRANTKRL